MICTPVTTGSRFLLNTLAHLDCQAQMVGSYGFTSLADPGSSAALIVNTLLALFIAIFAFRLLFGETPNAKDIISATLKVGIVLTLALSWPAYRVLVYDTVLKGPADIAQAITRHYQPDTAQGFAGRLQNIDTGIASLTQAGTGRQTGSLALEDRQEGAFRSVAMEDEAGFGWARTIYLAVTIGSLAALRIAGALLLATAPLFAGLLLFDFSRGIFAGWVRGLVLVALGSVGITLLLSIQIGILEPWLLDAINRRNLGYATPAAPTELLAICLAFGIASFVLLAFLTKVAFQNAPVFVTRLVQQALPAARVVTSDTAPRTSAMALHRSGGNTVVQGHSSTNAYYEGTASSDPARRMNTRETPRDSSALSTPSTPLGSSYRRNNRRSLASHGARDRRS